MDRFQRMLSSGLKIDINQLYINQSYWEEGPRLEMNLKIFPMYVDSNSSHVFNKSEVLRLRKSLLGFDLQIDDLFGPSELIDFILLILTKMVSHRKL